MATKASSRLMRPTFGAGRRPTDLVGDPRLHSTNSPGPGSVALDAADPSEVVPPGGSAAADLGAVEAGATLLPQGGYCTAD